MALGLLVDPEVILPRFRDLGVERISNQKEEASWCWGQALNRRPDCGAVHDARMSKTNPLLQIDTLTSLYDIIPTCITRDVDPLKLTPTEYALSRKSSLTA